MPFTLTLHFVSPHDRDLFLERVVPRLRGHMVEPPSDETAEAQGYQRVAISVTSPSAAQDVCRQAFGFLTHMKDARIAFAWPGVDGSLQYGEIVSGESRNADLLSTRLAAAARAFLDAEKRASSSEAAAEASSEVQAS